MYLEIFHTDCLHDRLQALRRKDSIKGICTIQYMLSHLWQLASIVQCLEENFQIEIHASKKLEVLSELRFVLTKLYRSQGFQTFDQEIQV